MVAHSEIGESLDSVERSERDPDPLPRGGRAAGERGRKEVVVALRRRSQPRPLRVEERPRGNVAIEEEPEARARREARGRRRQAQVECDHELPGRGTRRHAALPRGIERKGQAQPARETWWTGKPRHRRPGVAAHRTLAVVAVRGRLAEFPEALDHAARSQIVPEAPAGGVERNREQNGDRPVRAGEIGHLARHLDVPVAGDVARLEAEAERGHGSAVRQQPRPLDDRASDVHELRSRPRVTDQEPSRELPPGRDERNTVEGGAGQRAARRRQAEDEPVPARDRAHRLAAEPGRRRGVPHHGSIERPGARGVLGEDEVVEPDGSRVLPPEKDVEAHRLDRLLRNDRPLSKLPVVRPRVERQNLSVERRPVRVVDVQVDRVRGPLRPAEPRGATEAGEEERPRSRLVEHDGLLGPTDLARHGVREPERPRPSVGHREVHRVPLVERTPPGRRSGRAALESRVLEQVRRPRRPDVENRPAIDERGVARRREPDRGDRESDRENPCAKAHVRTSRFHPRGRTDGRSRRNDTRGLDESQVHCPDRVHDRKVRRS